MFACWVWCGSLEECRFRCHPLHLTTFKMYEGPSQIAFVASNTDVNLTHKPNLKAIDIQILVSRYLQRWRDWGDNGSEDKEDNCQERYQTGWSRDNYRERQFGNHDSCYSNSSVKVSTTLRDWGDNGSEDKEDNCQERYQTGWSRDNNRERQFGNHDSCC
ncbi:hypothetical protein AVEN_48580-1 [Araneus ventricosus]|uniref:Uncharacterized protein n=1 Tax=Araneus ventricosus TaxID=182803 RepID=A0A4Y2HF16_ARAVE|nr:hypothetical protein AVEN_48580-1 [Araneus ventricosus]